MLRRGRAGGARGGLTELPDAQLVVLGARGDVSALEQLYRRHAAFAIHLATRIEGSARDVEDIVHDAFLRAFERLGDLVDPAAFRAWLGSIVVHKVRSRMRRARLLGVLGMGKSSEPVDLDALASPAASPHARAQIAQIYALLQTLPADDRIAWILRSVEGHDLETVAQMTDCSLATVKRRISRAQHFLDGHLWIQPTARRHHEPARATPDRPGDLRDHATEERIARVWGRIEHDLHARERSSPRRASTTAMLAAATFAAFAGGLWLGKAIWTGGAAAPGPPPWRRPTTCRRSSTCSPRARRGAPSSCRAAGGSR